MFVVWDRQKWLYRFNFIDWLIDCLIEKEISSNFKCKYSLIFIIFGRRLFSDTFIVFNTKLKSTNIIGQRTTHQPPPPPSSYQPAPPHPPTSTISIIPTSPTTTPNHHQTRSTYANFTRVVVTRGSVTLWCHCWVRIWRSWGGPSPRLFSLCPLMSGERGRKKMGCCAWGEVVWCGWKGCIGFVWVWWDGMVWV